MKVILKNIKDSWFIEERAIHLAILHLTRRNDLIVTQPDTDYGINILVEIRKINKPTGRMFGIQIKANKGLQILSDGTLGINEVKIPLAYESILLQDLPFPLCLFLFQMENDEGYYKWINEPIIDSEGISKLVLNRRNIFKKITRKELDSIVEQVNGWYESRNVPEYLSEAFA